MSEQESLAKQVTVIKPAKGWEAIGRDVFEELIRYRDLFFFLVWRDIKVLYAQTILGFAWAILNPAIQIIIFTIIFGRVAKVPTDDVPYFLYCTLGIIPWTYMAEAMNFSSQSLILGQSMLGKVYFPRLLFPMAPVAAKLVDFGISLVILVGVMLFYGITPGWNILYLPVFLLMMICVPLAAGLWLSALAIRFRDVKFAMNFLIRMLMFTAPIVYSASTIPEAYRFLYSLNPIVGVIEGFRACLLGTPIPWMYVLPGMVVAVILLFTGFLYFKRMEKVFVDVI